MDANSRNLDKERPDEPDPTAEFSSEFTSRSDEDVSLTLHVLEQSGTLKDDADKNSDKESKEKDPEPTLKDEEGKAQQKPSVSVVSADSTKPVKVIRATRECPDTVTQAGKTVAEKVSFVNYLEDPSQTQEDNTGLPVPTLLSRQTARRDSYSTPGAHPMQPSALLDGSNSVEEEEQIDDRSNEDESQYLGESIPRATLVDLEANTNPSQHAVPHEDSEEFSPDATHKRTTSRAWLGCFAAIILVAGLVSLAVWRANTKEGEAVIAPPVPVDQDEGDVALTMDQYILQLLPEETAQTIQLEASLGDPSLLSPSSKAYKWLLEDPGAANYTDHRLVQRFALATLFHSTNGDEWVQNEHWLSYDHHECDWFVHYKYFYIQFQQHLFELYGIELPPSHNPCDPLPGPIPVEDTEDTRTMRHIWLPGNNLRGTIPNEVYLLTHLQSFIVLGNRLEGTLSSHMGRLAELQLLIIYMNQLSGTLPTEIGLISSLTWVFAQANPGLRGPIPSELGQLSRLKYFMLMDCGLTGTMPTELGALKLLRDLHVDFNDLTGTIPTELGRLDFLLNLGVGHNRLTGTIPTELGQLSTSDFHLIDMRRNSLSGPIPSELGSLTNLRLFWLEHNQLTGTIPPEVGSLGNHSFQILNVTDNLLSGVVPSELCTMAQLSFDCSNELCGCECSCSGLA